MTHLYVLRSLSGCDCAKRPFPFAAHPHYAHPRFLTHTILTGFRLTGLMISTLELLGTGPNTCVRFPTVSEFCTSICYSPIAVRTWTMNVAVRFFWAVTCWNISSPSYWRALLHNVLEHSCYTSLPSLMVGTWCNPIIVYHYRNGGKSNQSVPILDNWLLLTNEN